MNPAAVIPAPGIGDGLMMLIAAHALTLQGFKVTVFHPHLHELSSWFPEFTFLPSFSLQDLEKFEQIYLLNYHDSLTDSLLKLRTESPHFPLHVLYPTYNPLRHLPLTPQDVAFDPKIPLTESISRVFNLQRVTNGICIPSHLQYRFHSKQIVIHPSCTSPSRTWTSHKFVRLARLLKTQGFNPFFLLSPKEAREREFFLRQGFECPSLKTLVDWAEWIYESHYFIGNESGPGHLASNLHIPTLIIAGHGMRMKQWRPGFLKGKVVTPSAWIPNWKGMRLREKKWQWWISPSKINKIFNS